MVWSEQEPIVEIIIPDDGPQTPGSGTIYIGSNLPPELVAFGVTFAIVQWSSAAQFINGYKYFYTAATSDNTSPIVNAQLLGYCDNSSVLHNVSVFTKNGRTFSDTDYSDSIFMALGNLFWTVENKLPGPNIFLLGPTSQIQSRLFSDASKAFLTDTSGVSDVWQNVGSAGVLGGANYTAEYDYRRTFGRVVDFTAVMTFATPPTTLNLTFAVVPNDIIPDNNNNGRKLRPLAGLARTTVGVVSRVPIAGVVGNSGQIAILNGATNPNNYQVFELHGTWTVEYDRT